MNTNETTTAIYSSLANRIGGQQDAAIRRAINNHLGREDWTIEEVGPRVKACIYREMKTIMMDGEPIMIMGPVETSMDERGVSSFLQASRGYRILNDENGKEKSITQQS